MRKIAIQKMSLTNFKGVRKLDLNFNEEETNIFGDNGTFKTTTFDAFTWLLFGKDSSDRKDFQIKTLDKNNATTDKVECEVSAVLLVDGVVVTLRRILKENWTKKRGSETQEFTGNSTEYYWNDVPMQLKEYQLKVGSILDEQVFKMITNPLAFNSLKWTDRRNVLVQIADNVNDLELAGTDKEYLELLNELTQGKTLEDYKKQVTASITKAKQDLKNIPTRIDEVVKTKVEDFDFDAIRKEIAEKEQELEKIEKTITNKSSEFDNILKVENEKKFNANNIRLEIETLKGNLKHELEQKSTKSDAKLVKATNLFNDKNLELTTAETTLNSEETKLRSLGNEILNVKSDIGNKREEWSVENNKKFVFEENDTCCPTCKREFDKEDLDKTVAELEQNFLAEQSKRKSEINAKGKALTEELDGLEKEVVSVTERKEKGKEIIKIIKADLEILKNNLETEKSLFMQPAGELEDFETILNNNPEYLRLQKELEKVLATIIEVPVIDATELIVQKNNLRTEINVLQGNLRNETQNKAVDARVKDLEKEESILSQQILQVEKTLFVIEKFNRLRVDAIESSINKKFKIVKFKMFETQINGGEAECCETLINGVPFADANTASKVNAGLDIINTLCQFYDVNAPIFIDNRESVVKLIETESQVINLIVSESDKTLRVE